MDKEVLLFIKILEKHVPYVLVYDYVAILFGRTRTTEDVDFIIEKLSREQFDTFYKDLSNNGFWSVTVDSGEELYSMLHDKLAVRFAKHGKVVPNMEVKFLRDQFDRITLSGKVKVVTLGGNMFVGNIEQQIAYKKFILQS